MQTKQEIQQKLALIKPKLMEKYAIKKVGFFGSYARNQQTKNSDLDILIELGEGLGWEFFNIQLELEEFFNLKVDVVTDEALKKRLKENILNDVIFV